MRSTSIKKKKRNLHSYAASVEFQQMRLEIIGAEFSMSCISCALTAILILPIVGLSFIGKAMH